MMVVVMTVMTAFVCDLLLCARPDSLCSPGILPSPHDIPARSEFMAPSYR